MGVILSILNWIRDEWHRVVIFLLAIDHLYDRLLPMFEKYRTAEQYLDRRFHNRRHTMPLSGFATKVAAGFQVLNIALANAPKIMADIAAVEADQKDPTAELAALSQLLADVQPAVQALIALVPPPTTPTVPVTPAA